MAIDKKQAVTLQVVKEKQSEVTVENMERAMQSILRTLKRKAKSHGWQGCMEYVISDWSETGHHRSPLHVHVFLDSSHGSSTMDVIRKYWNAKGWGWDFFQQPEGHTIDYKDVYDEAGWLAYMGNNLKRSTFKHRRKRTWGMRVKSGTP